MGGWVDWYFVFDPCSKNSSPRTAGHDDDIQKRKVLTRINVLFCRNFVVCSFKAHKRCAEEASMEASIVYRPPLDFGPARSVVTGSLYRSGAVVMVQSTTNVPGTSGTVATVHDTSLPDTGTLVQFNFDIAGTSVSSRNSVTVTEVPSEIPSGSGVATTSVMTDPMASINKEEQSDSNVVTTGSKATESTEKKLNTGYRWWFKWSRKSTFGKEQTPSRPAPEHGAVDLISLQSGSNNVTGNTMTETEERTKPTTNRFGTKQQWFKWSRISVLGLIFCMC